MSDSDYRGRAELQMDYFSKKIKERIVPNTFIKEEKIKRLFLRVNIFFLPFFNG